MKTADIDLCVILFLFHTITATDPDDLAHIPPPRPNKPGRHEIGHQAAASEIGAAGSRMQFFMA